MENENENRDHNPLKDNQDDSWIIAALTTAFVAGVGATINISLLFYSFFIK